jgi:type I restriction enzyme S subunit
VNPANFRQLAEQVAISIRHLRYLLEQIEWHIPKATVWAFGSRIKWSHRPESDLDLAVHCDKETARKALPKLNDALEESDLPFRVQILDFDRLPVNMQENIKKNYLVLYQPQEKPLPTGWKETTLGEVAEVQNGYAFKSDEFSSAGIPIIKIKNVASGKITLDDLDYFSGSTVGLEQYFINKNDILVSMTGSHISQLSSAVGKLARYDRNEVAFLNQRVGKIYPIEGKSDNSYLFYLLSQPSVQIYWGNKAGGSANQANISPSIINSYNFILPPLPEQKAIASILSSFDDKIELLRRQNKTLESIAQTIFKEWFVKFTVNGKKLKVNSKTGLPEGWRMGKLGDILELAYGKALKEEERSGKGYPVIGSSGIVGYHSEYLIEGFGIVVGRKGSMGTVIWVEDNFFPIDTTFYVMDKLGVGDLYFHFFVLRNIDFQKIGSDSAVPGLNRTFAYSLELVVPKKEAVEEYNKTVEPIFHKMKNNNSQIQALSKLRDSLLPKLMKGEIRVKDE